MRRVADLVSRQWVIPGEVVQVLAATSVLIVIAAVVVLALPASAVQSMHDAFVH